MTDLVKRLKTATNPDIDHWRCDYRDLCGEAAGEIARLRCKSDIDARPQPPPQGGWQGMETAPRDETLILAACADGRMMIWRGDILASALSGRTPNHLQFPAIGWMPLPSPPQPTPDAGKEQG